MCFSRVVFSVRDDLYSPVGRHSSHAFVNGQFLGIVDVIESSC